MVIANERFSVGTLLIFLLCLVRLHLDISSSDLDIGL